MKEQPAWNESFQDLSGVLDSIARQKNFMLGQPLKLPSSKVEPFSDDKFLLPRLESVTATGERDPKVQAFIMIKEFLAVTNLSDEVRSCLESHDRQLSGTFEEQRILLRSCRLLVRRWKERPTIIPAVQEITLAIEDLDVILEFFHSDLLPLALQLVDEYSHRTYGIGILYHLLSIMGVHTLGSTLPVILDALKRVALDPDLVDVVRPPLMLALQRLKEGMEDVGDPKEWEQHESVLLTMLRGANLGKGPAWFPSLQNILEQMGVRVVPWSKEIASWIRNEGELITKEARTRRRILLQTLLDFKRVCPKVILTSRATLAPLVECVAIQLLTLQGKRIMYDEDVSGNSDVRGNIEASLNNECEEWRKILIALNDTASEKVNDLLRGMNEVLLH
ncbi:unnamed protein product [Cyprideis torosa]|uniref:Uncharacterized protein n=1 Tax=Cyprideis torosa TaxID=163714 RepID=A0A7R8WDT6_9CRUS|nr:unnamed protein product [Cyprideis torosa]CAG0892137.1 unnamed protein product [Cyprideis torosa]